MTGDYLRDPKEIYRQSFSTIRREADLSNFTEDIANIAVRLIHACGMTDIVNDIIYSPDAASSAREALKQGAPVLCDARMVAEGIISSRLPANNEVLCWNKHPECTPLANKMGTTLSAAAVEPQRQLSAAAVARQRELPAAAIE